MNHRRVASLFVVAVLIALPARAQGPQSSLTARIQNLEAQLAALQSQVATLQSQQAAVNGRVATLEGNITAADLAGTYRSVSVASDLDGGPPASIANFAVSGIATLVWDGVSNGGTGTVQNNAGGGINLVEGSPWTDSAFPLPPAETAPIAITWSYANGVLHISDGTPNLDMNLNVGAGGRVLTGAGLSDDNTADLMIAIRLQ